MYSGKSFSVSLQNKKATILSQSEIFISFIIKKTFERSIQTKAKYFSVYE